MSISVMNFARELELKDAITTLEQAIEMVGGATDSTNRMMKKLKDELAAEIKKNSSVKEG